MDDTSTKRIWVGLFISGALLGAGIALATLFLNDYFNRPQPNLEEVWRQLVEKEVEKEAETQIAINELLGGQGDAFLDITKRERKLCSLLTLEEINRLFPGMNLVATEQGRVPPFSDCDYFRDGSNVPVISFRYNFANLQIIKDLQKAQGIDVKTTDVAGVGDEAFFSEILASPDVNQRFRAIFFRIGMSGYSLGSFELSESQLRTLALFIAEKLIK